MAEKLNSMRLLDQHKISYEAHEFPDTIHSAVEMADHLGLSRDMVYKTLVVLPVESKDKPLLVMIAGPRELDLKKLAKTAGLKKAHMAPHKEAEGLTGLLTGGISVLALLHKHWPVYIDQSALDLDRIAVSAGKRGVNVELAVADLIKVTGAKIIETT